MNISTHSPAQEDIPAPVAPTAMRRRLSLAVSLFSIIAVFVLLTVLARATNTVSLSVWRTQLYTAIANDNLPDIAYYAGLLLETNPTDTDAYQALLRSLLLSGKPDEARAAVRDFLIASGGIVGYTLDAVARVADEGSLRPALAITTYLIAEIEVGTGFAGRSQQVTRNSFGRLQDAGLYNAYSARGSIHARLDDAAAATTDYRAAINALPDYFFGYEQLARFQFEQNDLDGAVETLVQGERHGALSLLFYVRVAEQYFFSGEPTDWVLTLLDLSHKYDNIAYFGWFVEGCVHRANGNLSGANAAMREWKSLRPNDPITIDQLLAECANPESKLFWHVDGLFESSPNYYGMEE